MKKVLAPVMAAALFTASAHAIEFSFGAASAVDAAAGFALADGTDLAPGSLVLFGTFDLAELDIAANSDNISLLTSVFHEISSATIGEGNPAGGVDESDPANAGLFSHALSAVDTTASGLNVGGQQLYYWVFNAPTIGAATQHGIFSDSSWLIPSGGALDTTGFDTDIANLTEGSAGHSISSTAMIPVGNFGPGLNVTGGGLDFTLAAIPEPSEVAMLVGVGALFFAWRRRQRAS